MPLPKIIRLEVCLTESKLVQDLRQRNAELEARNAELEKLNSRYQFDLVCQQKINLQLRDYCREEGYNIPRRLFTIWKSEY